MSYRKLYTHEVGKFLGLDTGYEGSKYVILGVPFDLTSTHRTGSRLAPSRIREGSSELESFCALAEMDIEEVGVCDVGDVDVSIDVEETLRRTELVCGEILGDGKRLVAFGGEHTISLGVRRALRETNSCVIVFDAHADLRYEYMGTRISHATVSRRIVEEIGPNRILEVGIRSISKEEWEFARKEGLRIVSMLEIEKKGIDVISTDIAGFSEGFRAIHLSIDVDVLDPAYAPGVQNPEPGGLSYLELVRLLSEISDQRITCVDICEVCPPYDCGAITSILAARLCIDLICAIEKPRRTEG